MNLADPKTLRFPAESHLSRHPFLLSPSAEFSYEQISLCVERTAQALRESGLQGEERVAFRAGNRAETIVLFLALWQAGCVAVPLNDRLPDGAIPPLLQGTGCRRMILWDEERHLKLPPGVRTLAATDLALLKVNHASQHGKAAASLSLLLNREATLIFTSGSTRAPKAALLTLSNYYYNALGANQNLPLGPGDVWLLSLPLYHVGGLGILFRSLVAGSAVFLPDSSDPAETVFRENRITHISLVPTQFYRMLRSPSGVRAMKAMKAILLGGGPLPASLLREAKQHRLPVYLSYGLTEMASQVTTSRSPEEAFLPNGAGYVLPYREVVISAAGEILVRGPTLFKGYVQAHNLHPARDAEGWFATGDKGEWDASGQLKVLGRLDNRFVSGGENIQPEEIEAVLTNIPGVLRAVVVPVPDAEFGERPVAFVELQPGKKIDPGALSRALRNFLPGIKIPIGYLEWPAGQEKRLKPSRHHFAMLARKALGR